MPQHKLTGVRVWGEDDLLLSPSNPNGWLPYLPRCKIKQHPSQSGISGLNQAQQVDLMSWGKSQALSLFNTSIKHQVFNELQLTCWPKASTHSTSHQRPCRKSARLRRLNQDPNVLQLPKLSINAIATFCIPMLHELQN